MIRFRQICVVVVALFKARKGSMYLIVYKDRVEGKKCKKEERRLIIENVYKSIIKTIHLVKSGAFLLQKYHLKGWFVMVSTDL